MSAIVQKILTALISKKKLIAWISAALIAVVAAVLGMNSAELKEAICSAPLVELPAPAPAPEVAPIPAAPEVKK